MTIRFELVPDYRTPDCEHDRIDACAHCCEHCNHDRHQCGGCGDPLPHQGHTRLGTCADCYRLYMTEGI